MPYYETYGLRGAVVLVVVLVVIVVLVVGGGDGGVVVVLVRKSITFYVTSFPLVLFLVQEIAKLQRERSFFCPGKFREGGGRL